MVTFEGFSGKKSKSVFVWVGNIMTLVCLFESFDGQNGELVFF